MMKMIAMKGLNYWIPLSGTLSCPFFSDIFYREQNPTTLDGRNHCIIPEIGTRQ